MGDTGQDYCDVRTATGNSRSLWHIWNIEFQASTAAYRLTSCLPGSCPTSSSPCTSPVASSWWCPGLLSG